MRGTLPWLSWPPKYSVEFEIPSTRGKQAQADPADSSTRVVWKRREVQPGQIRRPINSFSWLLWGKLAVSRGLWHAYLVPDVFCQRFWHLEKGEHRGGGTSSIHRRCPARLLQSGFWDEAKKRKQMRGNAS